MTREEGITTLWRGASATVSRAIVVNGAQLGSYTQVYYFPLYNHHYSDII